MQDNGTIWCDGVTPIDNFLSKITGGDGGACFIDKNEPDVLVTSSQNNHFTFLGNYQGQGQTGALYESGNFISSVDYDYNMNTLYANAVTTINRFQDSILRISGIPYGPIEGDFINLQTGSTVPFTTVKYSEHSPEGTATLYLGTMSGRMFKVVNAESSPDLTEIGSDDFPVAAISCIAIGNSEDTMLVTFSNYGVSSIWQTYDNGESWMDREGDLPDMPVRWALYHPNSSKAAILATELGTWTSYNLDEPETNWQPDNMGLANVRVDMLQLRDHDNLVLAGTHGRGLYTTTFDYNPSVGVQNIANKNDELSIYPNPASEILQIELTDTKAENISIEILDASGKIVSKGLTNFENGSSKINISNLTKGTYFVKIIYANKSAVRKIVKL